MTYAPRCAISYHNCVECGALFVARRGQRPDTAVCRQPACATQNHARRTAEWIQQYKIRHGVRYKHKRRLTDTTCAYCTNTFKGRAGAKYCSRTCYQRHISDNTKHVDGKHYTRRQRQRRASVAPISRTAIFERDRWTCHLCSNRINPKLRYPDPMSASIDHLLPLAQGGAHEPANIAAAHLACNMSKGYRGTGGEQLALIG